MTPRERVLAVYNGQTPDQVPLMLDLSHWYKKNYNVKFDLTGFHGIDEQLVSLHKTLNAVAYVEMGSFYELYFESSNISDKAWTDDSGVYHRQIVTPIGALEEERVFSEVSYSYNIKKYLVESVDDFEIVNLVMDNYRVKPRWDMYNQWKEVLGDLGVIYTQLPYSGLGYLIARNFGVEKTCMAMFDNPEKLKDTIDTINSCNLRILEEIIDGPFEVLFISDNFDSNVQNPNLFNQYSKDFYITLATRAHSENKFLAVHVDGEMKGCLKNFADCGVDCIDAATPASMFKLTPQQAREEAGADLILSGGIPANIFGPNATDDEFVECVKKWLDTKKTSSRLIMAAGDQVPTDAPLHKIKMLPRLVEKYGKY